MGASYCPDELRHLFLSGFSYIYILYSMAGVDVHFIVRTLKCATVKLWPRQWDSFIFSSVSDISSRWKG